MPWPMMPAITAAGTKEQRLDARHALEYVRDVLVELSDDRQVIH